MGQGSALLSFFPGVLWLYMWHFLYSVGPHLVSSLHIYTLLCRGHSLRVWPAKQETLTPPGHLVSPLVCRSVNVHCGALLLVPQWQCISSFVFYIEVKCLGYNTLITENSLYVTSHYFFLFTHFIMKLNAQIPNASRMCFIDFRVKRSKVKVTCIGYWKWILAHCCFCFTPVITELHTKTPYESILCLWYWFRGQQVKGQDHNALINENKF